MDKSEKMMYDSTEKMDLAKQQTQQKVECSKEDIYHSPAVRRASVMKHTLPRWASIFERLLPYLIWTTARGQCRPQKYKSRCTTPLPRSPPEALFVYSSPLRTAQRQEAGLTRETDSRGRGNVLTLCSFSRRSGLSGTPRRLCGMYQKQTFVCSGCGNFKRQSSKQK